MKRTLKSVCLKWQLPVMTMFAILFASCSSGVKDEITAMFNNVPEDAAVVMSGDLKKIVDQAGGEMKDGKIQSFGANALSGEEMKTLRRVMKNVEAGAVVGFLYKNEFYATCNLTDADGFMKTYAKETGEEWEKEGSYKVNGNCVITDDRLWITDRPDVAKIKNFMGLSESESFLSCKYAEKMAESSDAVSIWGSIDSLTAGLSFAEQTQFRMGTSMLFDSPEYIIGSVNFNKKGLEMKYMPVTSDYKPAKCVIEMEKIDISEVSALGGDANMIFAMGVSGKLIKKIKDLGNSMGGNLPSEMWDILSPIEGTIAMASSTEISEFKNPDFGYRAIVNTNGKNNAMLTEVLGEIGDVKVKGDKLMISKGSYGKGALDVAAAAKEMKDAWIAMALHGNDSDFKGDVYVLLVPADESLELRMKIISNK